MTGKVTKEIAKSSESLMECLLRAHTVASIKNPTSVRRVSVEGLDYTLNKFGVELQETISDMEIADSYDLDLDAQADKIAQYQLRDVLSLNGTVIQENYSLLLKAIAPKTRLADVIQFSHSSCWKNSAKKNEFTKYKSLADYIKDKYTCRELVYDAIEQNEKNLSSEAMVEKVFDAFTGEIAKLGGINHLLKHRHGFQNRFDKFMFRATERAISATCEKIYKQNHGKIHKNMTKPLREALGTAKIKTRN